MDVLEYTDISSLHKIGEGGSRIIYECDLYPGTVLKIRKPGWKDPGAENKLFKRLLLLFFPELKNRIFTREIHQIRSCDRQRKTQSGEPPLPRYFGSTQTDLGTAHIFEKVHSSDGKVVRLRELIEADGIGPYCGMLTDMARQLFDWKIVVYDCQQDNIVLDRRSGKDRFVMIDGFGNNNAIPFRSFIKPLNEYHLHRSMVQFSKWYGLSWDSKSRSFSYRP